MKALLSFVGSVCWEIVAAPVRWITSPVVLPYVLIRDALALRKLRAEEREEDRQTAELDRIQRDLRAGQ